LTEAAQGFLFFASLFFYSWWDVAYLPIILSSILFNYIVGNILSKDWRTYHRMLSKKAILTFGVIANVALLVYFKYMDFFIENINMATSSNFHLLNLALPLAISFFTFQQIAYLVDSYKQKTREHGFLNYAVFVTFFPQLIAGPIVHHKDMMPQFTRIRSKLINYKNIAMGLFIFSIGLFKKVVIADTFAIWATTGFDHATTLNFFEAWATSLSYTFQLYFDFSGYTDMAIGLALLFNIKIAINFNSPYKATSLIDFWNRWHITLSKFVNQYIFRPILNSFKTYTFYKGMMALLISLFIMGIWHGASWMFVVFGIMHGLGAVINHTWKKKIKIKIPKVIGWFLTFNFVSISMILFRAKEWDDVIKILSGMINLESIVIPIDFGTWLLNINGDKWTIVAILLGFIISLTFKNSIQMLDGFKLNIKTMLITSLLLSFSLLSMTRLSEFIYFNF
jgi:D-alanyl-lipoteichoic acid acyltransferase DltB (MBOAT superfamily)